VWLTDRRPRLVVVLVMRVMPVQVLVLQRFVRVLVDMTLADVEPHPKGHEHAARDQPTTEWFSQRHN
jgi:hypothetical protein